jgi:phosphoribosylaminoimidazolecarboxamide formyltransferase/IMP cyclohydrolase
MDFKIKTALISVFYKDGLDSIVRTLDQLGVTIYSTGGTEDFIKSLGISVCKVEDLTGYPSILDGRVKTLHPNIFGGILARREPSHQEQLTQYNIPEMDLVIVDLYPFEETVSKTQDHDAIIEKIDIGGISLIRAAAKNFQDVVVVPSKAHYHFLTEILERQDGMATLQQRQYLAGEAFNISSTYDSAIFNYLAYSSQKSTHLKINFDVSEKLRYGENPHQKAWFYGDLNETFEQLCGKELSYNNLVDIDAAVHLMGEFHDDSPTFAVLKHTNACGVCTRDTVVEAWRGALQADPLSAFGGVLICNTTIDLTAAQQINEIFYEVLIAPDFVEEAFQLLSSKSKRVLLKLKKYSFQQIEYKTLLNGLIMQEADDATDDVNINEMRTRISPTSEEMLDLRFANKCSKHLKSNTIVLVKNLQLIGVGCGQTSRVDACQQAIDKAKNFGFDLSGAVMASDAFFPFPDCVEIAHNAGITAVIQPGGSIKDQLSIDYCDNHDMAMVFTGIRHFKH